jgi:hypothetical protein
VRHTVEKLLTRATTFLLKKPKKNLMEMVVSKSKKDITFSTAGFLLRMPII